jgi:regulator of RNase E activity RraA
VSAPTAPPALEPRVRDLLARCSTATLTTQLFGRGLRNTYLAGLRPANPAVSRVVGQAFTLRYIPAREDIDVLSVFQDYDHPQRAAVEQAPPGSVLVVDCRGEDRVAAAGSILMTRLLRRGVAGFVADGPVRDYAGIASLEFPAFVRGPAATTNLARHHAVDLQVPIGCAGVAVYPGDVIVGDDDGVVCIPRQLADEIAEAAFEQDQMEKFLLGKVRDGAPLRGTYPPDQDTLAEYQADRLASKERSTP